MNLCTVVCLYLQQTSVDFLMTITMLCLMYTDRGNYFRVESITGRLYNRRPLQLSDPNWSAGHMTIIVQVSSFTIISIILPVLLLVVVLSAWQERQTGVRE